MEIKKEVKSYRVDYICDKCKVGKMVPSGMCLTSYPAQYPHFCDDRMCGASKNFYETYPVMKYEEVEVKLREPVKFSDLDEETRKMIEEMYKVHKYNENRRYDV